MTLHTVLMIQVENEIGMIPSARDHGPEAERAFASPVPQPLASYLAAHEEDLAPELREMWRGGGRRSSGTWPEVFGSGPSGEEVFMAWHFARYAESVAAAGKREYPLPMFVNAALVRPGHRPGQYPSGGPLPHLIDVWRAAAPSVDFLAPDIYFQNFVEWARRYQRSGNPLFVPEAMRSPEASVNALYAIGAHDAIGFSPFGIESIGEAAAKHLEASYGLLAQLEPLILGLQGKGLTAGLLPEGPEQRQPQQVWLGDTRLLATFERGAPPSLADGVLVPTGATAGPPPPFGRPRAPDRARRARRRRHRDHDHVRHEGLRQAGRDPERRGGSLRRGALRGTPAGWAATRRTRDATSGSSPDASRFSG